MQSASPGRLIGAVGGQPLSPLGRALLVLVVGMLITASTVLVHATGGTQHAWPHMMYVPVLLAAWGFGPAGGVMAALVAGLALGPGMPADVDAAIDQTTTNWIYRLGFFMVVGAISGALHRLVRRQLADARTEQHRFAALIDHAPDVIITFDAHGVVRYASPSVATVLGTPPAGMLGQRISQLLERTDEGAMDLLAFIGPGPSPRTEVRARHADGSWRQMEVVVTDLLADPDMGRVVLNARDVTERHAIEAELRHQARHDHETGLASRGQLTDAVSQALAARPAGVEDVALLLITLDRFTSMQQAVGPDTATQLVRAMARRLAGRLRPGDLLARYATDQFAVLCADVGGREGARQIGTRLRHAADEPFLLISGEIHLPTSVGLALGASADDGPQLLRDVHTASHRAGDDSDRVVLFDPSWRSEATAAIDTETALHSALRRDEFELWYQPIIDLGNGRIRGVEALLRWNHPRLGPVPPGDFIPVAEQTGLIADIGLWVLRTACAQLAAWRDQLGRHDLTVAVNVSARQLDDARFGEHIREALRTTGLPAAALTLELTETALLGDLQESIRTLTGIKSQGVLVAVDDFGTGYSSLGYLKHLPVDALKMDRTFVSGLGEDEAITSAIIGLARTLGLDTIAEGVEEQSQHDRLVALGCQAGQGYLYAHPQPPAAITELLSRSLRIPG